MLVSRTWPVLRLRLGEECEVQSSLARATEFSKGGVCGFSKAGCGWRVLKSGLRVHKRIVTTR